MKLAHAIAAAAAILVALVGEARGQVIDTDADEFDLQRDPMTGKLVLPGNDGKTSLREAIAWANDNPPGGHLITFALPPTATITLGSALPVLTNSQTSIIGSGQTIDASRVLAPPFDVVHGLVVMGNGNLVENLRFVGCGRIRPFPPQPGGSVGLFVIGDGNSILSCNAGAAGKPNVVGISVRGNGNEIGKNVVGAALWHGIGAEGDGNHVFENKVGFDPLGNALSIGQNGIYVTGDGNVVGPHGSFGGNVVANTSSAALYAGITIRGGRGNQVDTNTLDGNRGDGIAVQGGATNTDIGPDNIVRNCGDVGVIVFGAGTSGSDVHHNRIGGIAPVTTGGGNLRSGVWITQGASGNVIRENFIGGNGKQGVHVSQGAIQNTITLNEIRANLESGVSIHGASTGCTVDKNQVYSSGLAGIYIDGSDDATIEKNFVGTDARGAVGLGNGATGIQIQGGAKRATLRANRVAANGWCGIQIALASTDDCKIVGNDIGAIVSATGAAGRALANWKDGIRIQAGPKRTIVGGLAPADRNVISGNLGNGIRVAGAGTDDTTITNNYIGVERRNSRKNVWNMVGIEVHAGAKGTTIGGAATPGTLGAGNVVSGNSSYGIWINAAPNTKVYSNRVGVDETGTRKVANGDDGIFIDATSTDTQVGAAGKGNVVSGNVGCGVSIVARNTSRTVVAGNKIGTDRQGSTALPNELYGIRVLNADSTTIGGITSQLGNVVSGNRHDGIVVQVNSLRTKILGNSIGLDHDALRPIPNGGSGIVVETMSLLTLIGGHMARGEGNAIAANKRAGIVMTGPYAARVEVYGNLVGLNQRLEARANQHDGILIESGTHDDVIGDKDDKRNIIAANKWFGIHLRGTDTIKNKIQANWIGLERRPNEAGGILIEQDASTNTIGGASAPDNGNVIAYNKSNGIELRDATSLHNRIQKNSIYENEKLGIDLGDDGVTVNNRGDPLAARAGPNAFVNTPDVLIHEIRAPDGVVEKLSLRGIFITPNGPKSVELFKVKDYQPKHGRPANSPAEQGEGMTFLGEITRFDPTGTFTIDDLRAAYPGQVDFDTKITATATDNDDNTSEFRTAAKIRVRDWRLGAENTTDFVSVARWDSAYPLPAAPGGGAPLGDTRVPNYIDLDQRRFKLWLFDPLFNLGGQVDVNDLLRIGTNIDPPNAITIRQNGADADDFDSRPQLLNSNEVDNGEAPQLNAAGAGIGTFRPDDGQGNLINHGDPDVRTHRASVGGALVVQYVVNKRALAANPRDPAAFLEARLDVNRKSGGNATPGRAMVVRLALHTFGRPAAPATPIWSNAEIGDFVDRAREAWAQAGITIETPPVVLHPPATVVIADATPDGHFNVNNDPGAAAPSAGQAFIQANYRSGTFTIGGRNMTVIDVYFLPTFADSPSTNARSFRKGNPGHPVAPFKLTIGVGQICVAHRAVASTRSHYTLAHELGHMLMDEPHSASPPWTFFPRAFSSPQDKALRVDFYRRLTAGTAAPGGVLGESDARTTGWNELFLRLWP